MLYSLIICTIHRTTELERLLKSLLEQTYKSFELIIIDQNSNDSVQTIVSNFSTTLTIKYVQTLPCGLSNARNMGLPLANGDVIAFTDDDCWYPNDFFSRLNNLWQDELDGIVVKSVDKELKPSNLNPAPINCYINRENVWTHVISYTVFLRKPLCDKIGPFDSNLGVGNPTVFQSGEETDYILRAIALKAKIYYTPHLHVFHTDAKAAQVSNQKAYKYGAGMGKVLKKHRYSVSTLFLYIVKPLGGSIIYLLMFRLKHSMYYYHVLSGRLYGLWHG